MKPTLEERVKQAMQTERSVKAIARKSGASVQYVLHYLQRNGHSLPARPQWLPPLAS